MGRGGRPHPHGEAAHDEDPERDAQREPGAHRAAPARRASATACHPTRASCWVGAQPVVALNRVFATRCDARRALAAEPAASRITTAGVRQQVRQAERRGERVEVGAAGQRLVVHDVVAAGRRVEGGPDRRRDVVGVDRRQVRVGRPGDGRGPPAGPVGAPRRRPGWSARRRARSAARRPAPRPRCTARPGPRPRASARAGRRRRTAPTRRSTRRPGPGTRT